MRIAGSGPEVFPAFHRGRYLLHCPEAGASALINRQFFDVLERAKEGEADAEQQALSELRAWGLTEQRLGMLSRKGPDPEPTELTLALTGRCNLRCTYCYAEGGEDRQVMSLATARVALEFVTRNALRRRESGITLHLHGGGEITTVWDRLGEIVHLARELTAEADLGLRLTAGTNGVMPADRARTLAGWLDEATVSMDGTRDVHDRQRPRAGGGGSLEDVTRTLRIFDAERVSYGVRMTVTSESVDRLPESVAEVCRVCQAKVIQVEPAAPLGRFVDRTPVDAAAFVRAFREARRLAAEAGRELRYSGARPWVVTDVFCKAVEGALCITPRGRLTACYEAPDDPDGPFHFGHVDISGKRLAMDHQRREALLRFGGRHQVECTECIARFHCAGDCPMKRDAEGNSPRCEINRGLTLDLILEGLLDRESEDCARSA
jgi:uncharacterized protein